MKRRITATKSEPEQRQNVDLCDPAVQRFQINQLASAKKRNERFSSSKQRRGQLKHCLSSSSELDRRNP
jgi:hypothetical protein